MAELLTYLLDSLFCRGRILTLKMGKDHLKYLIFLIDLLATCAEGENRCVVRRNFTEGTRSRGGLMESCCVVVVVIVQALTLILDPPPRTLT